MIIIGLCLLVAGVAGIMLSGTLFRDPALSVLGVLILLVSCAAGMVGAAILLVLAFVGVFS